jgi:hypothetical protein
MTMKETLDLLGKILTNILTALYEPFGFSLLLSFLAMFFYLYAYESIGAGKGWKIAIMTWYQKFKESVFFRKLFFLAFVTSLILFRTLLNRQLWMNPLSDVMGGWGIWGTVNSEQKLTTECIENVIMMVPFSSVVMWTFQEKMEKGLKKILWQSGKITFCFSVSIEMLQLLLRLGTFQLSDIFYNTDNNNAILEKKYTAFNKCVGLFCVSTVTLISLAVVSIFIGI